MVVDALFKYTRRSVAQTRVLLGKQLLRWEVAKRTDRSKRREKMIRVYLRNIYDEMKMNDLECSLEEKEQKRRNSRIKRRIGHRKERTYVTEKLGNSERRSPLSSTGRLGPTDWTGRYMYL